MNVQSDSMRQRILDAACDLFANHGYAAVSTRMIAEKVGIRHGTVRYHFDSKEALYIEVFRSIYRVDQRLTYDVLLEREPIILDTPGGKAYAIQRIVTDFFHRHLLVMGPWKRQLVLRELFEPSPAFAQLSEEILQREGNKMIEFYFLLQPGGSRSEAYIWAHLPDALLLNYMVATAIYKIDADVHCFEEMGQKLIKISARSMISMLDLPVPDMLK